MSEAELILIKHLTYEDYE